MLWSGRHAPALVTPHSNGAPAPDASRAIARDYRTTMYRFRYWPVKVDADPHDAGKALELLSEL